MITDDELELIQWRAGRACHFEGTFLPESLHAKEAIEEDIPRLVNEIRQLQKNKLANGAGDEGDLLAAVRGLIEYRKQAGPLNFQLEKADTFIFRMRVALEPAGEADE